MLKTIRELVSSAKELTSIDELRGEDAVSVKKVISYMNGKYDMNVVMVENSMTEHGGYLSWPIIRDLWKEIPFIDNEPSEEDYKDGIVILNPSFMNPEVAAHEMGHAVYFKHYGIDMDRKNALKVKFGIEAFSTVASIASGILKRHRLASMALGVATQVPTLVEEAYATKRGFEALENLGIERSNGLYKAYGTYVLRTVSKAFGGDPIQVAQNAHTAFKR